MQWWHGGLLAWRGEGGAPVRCHHGLRKGRWHRPHRRRQAAVQQWHDNTNVIRVSRASGRGLRRRPLPLPQRRGVPHRPGGEPRGRGRAVQLLRGGTGAAVDVVRPRGGVVLDLVLCQRPDTARLDGGHGAGGGWRGREGRGGPGGSRAVWRQGLATPSHGGAMWRRRPGAVWRQTSALLFVESVCEAQVGMWTRK